MARLAQIGFVFGDRLERTLLVEMVQHVRSALDGRIGRIGEETLAVDLAADVARHVAVVALVAVAQVGLQARLFEFGST